MVGINIDKKTRDRLDKFREKLGKEKRKWISSDEAIVILLRKYEKK